MKITIRAIRKLIRESLIHEVQDSSLKEVSVSQIFGSTHKGFKTRLTITWDIHENFIMWLRLRKTLLKFGSGTSKKMEPWSGTGPRGVVLSKWRGQKFLDISLKSSDLNSANLEREAFIGVLEQAGFVVK